MVKKTFSKPWPENVVHSAIMRINELWFSQWDPCINEKDSLFTEETKGVILISIYYTIFFFLGPATTPGIQQNWASTNIWMQHGVFLLPNMQEQSGTGRHQVRIKLVQRNVYQPINKCHWRPSNKKMTLWSDWLEGKSWIWLQQIVAKHVFIGPCMTNNRSAHSESEPSSCFPSEFVFSSTGLRKWAGEFELCRIFPREASSASKRGLFYTQQVALQYV